jgi:SAM-dependent methyltransferase
MLAQQMTNAGRAGDVTWLDRSAAARRVAEARVAARKLGNVVFQEGSLLDLPGSGLGPFDYIDCCGVLHHLPDPLAGLKALVSALAPGGGLGLMVYAPHGRTGVYMAQDALRLLAPPDETPAARVEVAKRLWRQMPETAWLRRNPWITDHEKGGDAGLYDLLLNPRDVAFTVPAFNALITRGELAHCVPGGAAALRPAFLSVRPQAAPAHRGHGAGSNAPPWPRRSPAIWACISPIACVTDAPAITAPWDDPAAIPCLRELDGAKLADRPAARWRAAREL